VDVLNLGTEPDPGEVTADPDSPIPGETVTVTVPIPAPRVPETQLTPDQRRIRDLEDRLAKEMGRKDPEIEFEPPVEGTENIRIHFVSNGFTALGQVWYVGQELEFTPGSQAYQDTCDRYGRSWLELRDDPAGQEAKYGAVKFRSGAWPGLSLEEGVRTAKYQKLAPMKPGQKFEPSDDEVRQAAAAEARRRRAAPRIPAA